MLKLPVQDSDWVEGLFRKLNLNPQFELCFGALRVVLCLDVPSLGCPKLLNLLSRKP